MNSDQETAKRLSNSFVILLKLCWGAFAAALAVGVVLWALGNSKATLAYTVAPVFFIFACVFSNGAGHHANRSSIIDLQNRLSALEAGSPNESESES